MRAALALVVMLGSVTASADGIYFSESVGGANVKDELAQQMTDTFHIQIAVGYRLNKSWAVEGYFAGDLGEATWREGTRQPVAARCIDCGNGGGSGGQGYYQQNSLTSTGLAVKYLRPLGEHVEVYLRGQLGKAWLDESDFSGRGLGLGTGIQLKGKVRALGFLFWPLFFVPVGPKVTAAMFVDGGSDFYRLHRHGDLDNSDAIDGSLSHLTIGWAVGADF
jgi:hypothetical protein